MIYAFGPYATGLVGWLPMLISMAWMPLALLFFEQALRRRSLLRAALAGAVLAVQFLNGWPHGSYITAFALGAALLWELGARVKSYWPNQTYTSSLALALVTGATALGLAAPVLLPFLEFWGHSNYIAERGLEAAALEGNVTVLALLGAGGSEGHGAYLGAVGLLLALLGAIHGRGNHRWLYVLIGAFGLLVAFGGKAPLYGLLYGWVPGFRTFHVPGRFMVLFVFAAAVLAAMGADALLRRPARRIVLTALVGGAVLMIPLGYTLSRMLGTDAIALLANNLLHPESGPYLNAAMASHLFWAGLAAVAFLAALATGRLSGPAALGLALLILGADLLLYQGKTATYFSRIPAALRTPGPAESIRRLAGEGDFRVAGFHQTGASHFMSDFPFNVNPALDPPNLSLLYGLEDLQGYLPLRLRGYADYLTAVNGGSDDYHWALVNNFQSPLLDLLNLRYVMLRENEERLRDITIATNPEVRPGTTAVIRPGSILATALKVNSYLGNAAELENGKTVARITLRDASGETVSFPLRAGMETAEWAYDRPDVVSRVRHERAPIAMTRNLPASTHVYTVTLALPRPMTITEVAVDQTEPSVTLAITELIATPANPASRWEEVGELNGATLYRNRMALPRVLVVPAAEGVPTQRAALDRLQSPGFDPRRTVLLEGYSGPASGGISTAEAAQVETLSRGNNALRLSVRGTSSGFLLLNELSYPGWNAYLDGRQVAVWRANYLFRAIEVPPGDHDVEFRFEPDSLKLGLALFVSTLALLLATAATLHVRSRQQRKESSLP